jgi:hypothetical protein
MFMFRHFLLYSTLLFLSLSSIGQGVLTQPDASSGVKEALAKGLTTAVLNLNKTDGFFGTAYKVLLPPDAQKIESVLRKVGMGAKVDTAILAINRGAEKAVGAAAPIFGKAIREITLTDAVGLVRGGNNSITQFFQE